MRERRVERSGCAAVTKMRQQRQVLPGGFTQALFEADEVCELHGHLARRERVLFLLRQPAVHEFHGNGHRRGCGDACDKSGNEVAHARWLPELKNMTCRLRILHVKETSLHERHNRMAM